NKSKDQLRRKHVQIKQDNKNLEDNSVNAFQDRHGLSETKTALRFNERI
ncbi:9092_t:CDS:2, partial [Funneliformis caledonium]